MRAAAPRPRAAFGNGDLYVERYLPRARHVEVQIVGDGTGQVAHVWERECTLQRRHQKLVEIAPSPTLTDGVRERLIAAALRMAAEVRYGSLGTFEFLSTRPTPSSRASTSSRPIRGCRSSTRSPRK